MDSESSRTTPIEVLSMLKEGNERFMANKVVKHNYPEEVRTHAGDQNPGGVIISCVDARVPVEIIFDQGIGELFVLRLAGNVVDPDMIASLEFACLIKQAKLIVVMGHTDCGAVKGAIDLNRGVLNPPGNKLKSLLLEIMPAVHEADKIFKGEETSSNEQYVDLVCKFNVSLNIRIILDNSPMLGDLVEHGQLLIMGAIYDLATGKVNFEAG